MKGISSDEYYKRHIFKADEIWKGEWDENKTFKETERYVYCINGTGVVLRFDKVTKREWVLYGRTMQQNDLVIGEDGDRYRERKKWVRGIEIKENGVVEKYRIDKLVLGLLCGYKKEIKCSEWKIRYRDGDLGNCRMSNLYLERGKRSYLIVVEDSNGERVMVGSSCEIGEDLMLDASFVRRMARKKSEIKKGTYKGWRFRYEK